MTDTSLKKAIELLTELGKSPENSATPEYITIMEACKISGFSRWAISRWIAAGFVRAIKLGKARTSRVRIDAASLRAYLDSKAIQPKKSKKEA